MQLRTEPEIVRSAPAARPAARERPAPWPVGAVATAGAATAGQVLALQRLAGNAAVHRLLGGLAPPTVQRCGGDVHEGCGCAEDPAPAPAPLTVSRQGEGAQQGFQDGTPDNPNPALPPGSRYERMDPEVRAMLARTLTARSYGPWAADKPTNLGAALDMMGVENINTLVQLKYRMFPKGLWSSINTIRNVWTTSSLGIDYNGADMQGAIDSDGTFCKDTSIGQAYHSGQCWREIVQANTPGLHYCVPNSIHIDPHQTSTGTQGGVQLGGGSWVRYRSNFCSYSLIAFVSHMADVEGGRSVNVFHRYAKVRERIRTERARASRLRDSDPAAPGHVDALQALEQRRLALDPRLRDWAIEGFEGGDAGDQVRAVDRELGALESELDREAAALDDIEARQAPPPSADDFVGP
jgi:hypothetical protein